MMKHQCGDMQMSDSRSCCQKAPHAPDATSPQANVCELHALTATVAVYAIVILFPPPAAKLVSQQQLAFFLSESPPVSISILRI